MARESKKNKSCNLEITKYSINKMKGNQINKYILLVFLLANFAGLVSAQQQGYSCFGSFGVMSGYGYGLGWILMILITIALILFIVWIIKQITGDERRRK